ncbi:MAG: hypothetical protein ACFFEO_14525 [Candidatus Thorarchaeota archaeon]
MIKPFKLSIGSTELSIQDRYTLIKGKFKKNLLNNFKSDAFLELVNDLTTIPIINFINVYLKRSPKLGNLKSALELLTILHEFNASMEKNIELTSKYTEILNALIIILRYNSLLKKEELLQRELDITEKYNKISDLSASTDLLKKLNESLTENKRKLNYLEEDYFQQKNQIDEIKSIINDYNLEIKELTKKKKEYFSYINKITREMEGNSHTKGENVEKLFESDENLTNSQKIKTLQKKAKETQNKISKLKTKISKSELKFNQLNPVFETYNKDYQNLRGLIETDTRRINELDSKIKYKIKNQETSIDRQIDINDMKSTRSLQEIDTDIRKVSYELKGTTLPSDFIDPQNPEDLSLAKTKLEEFNDLLKNQRSKIEISINEENLIDIINSFKDLENTIEEFERIINKFLKEINLKSSFKIYLSDDNDHFLLLIRFLRDNKDHINYEDLTTPEKIFFIITYYLSLELQVENENIVFSNLIIPSKYNKAGSIFRTIRKIIPIFEKEENFSKYNLVFILSNLDMKKEIKGLKIVTIQENE